MKRISELTKGFAVFILAGLSITSCSDDDVSVEKSGYTIALRAQGAANESADYLVRQDTITEGAVSAAGKGIEQDGWRSYGMTNNRVFSIGYGDAKNCVAYELDANGQLVEAGEFLFQKTLDIFGADEAGKKAVAIEVPRSGKGDRVFHLLDTEDVSIVKRVNSPIYDPGADVAPFPTASLIKGSRVFVPFYPVSIQGNFATPSVDTAYVAIYSYPELELEKVIKDLRTGPFGIYGNSNAIVEDDNGDLYAYSSSSLACGFTKMTKPSSILKIANGTTEFDADYHFNIEEATGGKKMNWFQALGNGKAIARLITNDDKKWAAFKVNVPICELVILDLKKKTVTPVSGIPLHGGQYDTSALVENGMVYMSVTTATEAYIYEINVAEASGKKGAKLEGIEAAGIFNIK